MIDLADFKVIEITNLTPRVCISKNGFMLNRPSVMCLRCKNRVSLKINEENKQLIVEGVEDWKYDGKAICTDRRYSFSGRVHSKNTLRQIVDLCHWDLNHYRYRIVGQYEEETMTLIFNLEEATQIQLTH